MRGRRAPVLPPRRRRPLPEPVVPMINVVFLLLVFLLMSARIAPPPPFEVTLPRAAGEADAPGDTLLVAADGRLAFGTARGAAALEAALGATAGGALRLEADARLPAANLARLLARLAAGGADAVLLVTREGK